MLLRRRLLLSALAAPIGLSRADARGDAPATGPSSETIRTIADLGCRCDERQCDAI
jgi:hypothetical protein